jgi:hypothetical protein
LTLTSSDLLYICGLTIVFSSRHDEQSIIHNHSEYSSFAEQPLNSVTRDGQSWPRFFVVSFRPLQAKAWIVFSFDHHNLFSNPFEVNIHLTLSFVTTPCFRWRYQTHRNDFHRSFYTTMTTVPYFIRTKISVEFIDSWRWDR